MEVERTDAQAYEYLIRKILNRYDDLSREGTKETPARIIRAWDELLLNNEPLKLTVFHSNGYDQMIVSKDISFYSFCEHHFIPFFGTVKIGYVPNDKIIGISKLPRIVNYYSKGLHTQEYLTHKIAEAISTAIKPKGVGVQMIGRHLCQEMRGVKKRANVTTTALLGIFKEVEARSEFLSY